MSKLYIDTRDNNRIVVRLEVNKKIFEEESRASRSKAQATLPLIEKVLKRAKLKISDVKETDVATKKGSFTGLRVGISIANALAFGLVVKVNGHRLGKLAQPQY